MASLIEIYRRFPTENDCLDHLAFVRWPDGPLCPYCGAARTAKHTEAKQRSRYQCQICSRSFSATVGTIFHRSHVDLQRWFLLIGLMLSARKGLSSAQAARDLELRQPTVWSMMHRIRKAMVDQGPLLSGLVEMDETWVGGKPRKRNRRDDDPPGGQGVTSKRPVIGAVERGGRVKAMPLGNDDAAEMVAALRAVIDPRGTMLTTDEHPGYGQANRFVAHRTINHSISYVERDLFSGQFGPIHTNTIEGFWAILKRAVFGQFHHVSRRYLPLYLNEISYRYNMRLRDDGFDVLLHLAVKP